MSKSGIKVFTPAVLYNLNSSINPLNICLNSIGTEMIISRETIENNTSIIGIKNKDIKTQIEYIIQTNIEYIIQRWDLDISPNEIKIDIIIKMPEDTSLGMYESILNNLYFGISNLFKLGHSKRDILENIQNNKANKINIKALITGILGGIHINFNQEYYRIPVISGISIGLINSEFFKIKREKKKLRKKEIAKSNLLLAHSLHSGNIELLKSSFKKIEQVEILKIIANEKNIKLEEKTDNIGNGFTENDKSFYTINQNSLTTDLYTEKLANELSDKNAKIYYCKINLEGTELL